MGSLRYIALALRHFGLTFVVVSAVGAVVLYFQIDSISAYLLAVFLSLVQPFIDKVREIQRNHPLGRPPQSALGPRPHHTPDVLSVFRKLVPLLFQRLVRLLGGVLLLGVIVAMVTGAVAIAILYWRF